MVSFAFVQINIFLENLKSNTKHNVIILIRGCKFLVPNSNHFFIIIYALKSDLSLKIAVISMLESLLSL